MPAYTGVTKEEGAAWDAMGGGGGYSQRDAKNAETLVSGEGEIGNISDSDIGTIVNNPDIYGPEAVAAAKKERENRDRARVEEKRHDIWQNNADGGYDENKFYLGGDENYANEEAARLKGEADKYGARGDAYEDVAAGYRDQGSDAWGKAMTADERKARAWEDSALSGNEEMGRGEQAGSTMLAREAAMGLAPSQAEMVLQQGFNRASAEQTSQAGGARGLAALSQAQNNASASQAALHQQTATEASRLRAQEMAEARGLYGSLSGQLRQGDQGRLQMGNQMSQYNASLNEQYGGRMGQMYGQAGALGHASSQTALGNAGLGRGYNQDANNVLGTQLNAGIQQQGMAQAGYENSQGRYERKAGAATAQANRAEDKEDAEDAAVAEGVIGGVSKGAEVVGGLLGSKKETKTK